MHISFRAQLWFACVASALFTSVAFAQYSIGIDGLQQGMTRIQVSAVLASKGVQAKEIDNSLEFTFRDPQTGIAIAASLRFREGHGLNVVMFTVPPTAGIRQYSAWLLQLHSQYSSSLRSRLAQESGAEYWTCATPSLWVSTRLLEDQQAWLTYNAAGVGQEICASQKALWSQSKVAYAFAPVAPATPPIGQNLSVADSAIPDLVRCAAKAFQYVSVLESSQPALADSWRTVARDLFARLQRKYVGTKTRDQVVQEVSMHDVESRKDGVGDAEFCSRAGLFPK